MAFMRDPISAKDIAEFIESDGDDFGFEMKVLRVCLDAKLQAEHGGTYRDPLSGVDRQFDIRAKWGEWSSGHCQIRFAIECKNLRASLPLLINRVPRLIPESYHDVIRRKALCLPEIKRPLAALGLHKCGELVGKSLCAVGRKMEGGSKPGKMDSDSSEVYERWGQAVSSAAGMVSDFVHELETIEQYSAEAAFFPVLVVPEGRLWAVDYDSNGAVTNAPTQVPEASVYLGKQVHGGQSGRVIYKFSHLLIYTFPAFKSLVSALPTLENGGGSKFVHEAFRVGESRC